jgi:hypothetical protein
MNKFNSMFGQVLQIFSKSDIIVLFADYLFLWNCSTETL